MASIGISSGAPTPPAVGTPFWLGTVDAESLTGPISDSTGRFATEIKLLNPLPKRGLFLVANDMGKDSFPGNNG
jgi:hypothetical protein